MSVAALEEVATRLAPGARRFCAHSGDGDSLGAGGPTARLFQGLPVRIEGRSFYPLTDTMPIVCLRPMQRAVSRLTWPGSGLSRVCGKLVLKLGQAAVAAPDDEHSAMWWGAFGLTAAVAAMLPSLAAELSDLQGRESMLMDLAAA